MPQYVVDVSVLDQSVPDDVPLKMVLAPGNYRCDWQIQYEDRLLTPRGDIDLLADRPPAGGVFGEVPFQYACDVNGATSASLPQRYDFPVVHGQLENGLDIVLLDVSLTVWEERPRGFMNIQGKNAQIDAAVAVVGPGIPLVEALEVDSCQLQITGLDAVAGTAPIKSTSFPRTHNPSAAIALGVTTNPEARQEWQAAGTTVALDYIGSYTAMNGYKFGIRFSPIVEIRLAEPVRFLDFYDRWVQPAYRVLCALSGKDEQITYLAVTPEIEGDDRLHRARRFQVYASPIQQKPYEAVDPRTNHDGVVDLASNALSLLALINQWQDQTACGNPLLHTYDPYALGRDQHPRARFLLLLQAIEGLCGYEQRFAGRQTAYRKKRERVLNYCLQFLSGSNRKFIKSNLLKSSGNLQETLREMVGSLPIDLTTELEKTALVVQKRADGATGVTDALRLVRNDLAHGNASYDPHDLLEVVRILTRIARAHLIRVLGGNESIQSRVLRPGD